MPTLPAVPGSGRPQTRSTADILAAHGGACSVAEFVRDCLYHPEHGYYTRHIRTVGRSGDFSTSATMHPALGAALAGWLMEEAFRPLQVTHFIEVGGGDGSLALAVLRALPWWKQLFFRYHMVEVSPPLRHRQEVKLWEYRVQWHNSMEEALDACGGQAWIFANELVDAFPPRVFERTPHGWSEVGLALENGYARETLTPVPPEELKPYSVCKLWMLYDGRQRVEVHGSYRQWLQSWAPRWKRGKLMLIDYGEKVHSLYIRRPAGSIRAYFSHVHLSGMDVYARPGQQDITADVNFTDVMNWGEAEGLVSELFCTQGEWLEAYLPEEQAGWDEQATVASLLDPDGAGGAFKVLVQRRGPEHHSPATA